MLVLLPELGYCVLFCDYQVFVGLELHGALGYFLLLVGLALLDCISQGLNLPSLAVIVPGEAGEEVPALRLAVG